MTNTCKCPHCGGEINPASLLGQGKKTRTAASDAARKLNASKPRPNAKGKVKCRKKLDPPA